MATTFREITHPDDLDLTNDHVRRLLRGEVDSYDVEKRYIKKDGGTVYVLNSISAIRNADGSVRYTTAVTQDTTERKLAERALAASQARYRDIVEITQEGVWVLDRSGQIGRASCRERG